jgi:HNH endonuclease
VPRTPPFAESDARAAIAEADSWSEALRLLGYQSKGCNYRTLQRWTRHWEISTDHFDPNLGRRRGNAAREIPIEEILVENSTYSRGHLKDRLLNAGLKKPECEMCGQGDVWRGVRMSMVLDHINGIAHDHRLENLRMLCPNCAATLDTHCGRNLPRQRLCPSCQQAFVPRNIRHRYCSEVCWGNAAAELYRGSARPETRKVSRPSYDQLQADLASMSFLAVGRKYGVSDNAVRKWLRWYERQAEREERETKSSGAEAA